MVVSSPLNDFQMLSNTYSTHAFVPFHFLGQQFVTVLFGGNSPQFFHANEKLSSSTSKTILLTVITLNSNNMIPVIVKLLTIFSMIKDL